MRLAAILLFLATAMLPGISHAASTLETVRARGMLRCGTENDTPGSGAPDSNGVLQGIDIEYCRALAAAVFGDAGKVTFIHTSTLNRFSVLQSGDIDVLIRETTNLFSRDTQIGLIFATTIMYDAQGALVPTKLGAKSLADLAGASICVLPGSNSELNIADYFRSHDMAYTPISIDNLDALRRSFFEGRCDVFTGDRLMLSSNRAIACSTRACGRIADGSGDGACPGDAGPRRRPAPGFPSRRVASGREGIGYPRSRVHPRCALRPVPGGGAPGSLVRASTGSAP